jgi:translation elongation factor EF-Tu-like GTPase
MSGRLSRESVRASLQLRTKEAGGRGTPILPRSGQYKPHVRVGQGEYLGVRFVAGPEAMEPGDQGEVVFDLMYTDRVDYSALQEGVQFELLEGNRLVGVGTVLGRARVDVAES